MEWPLAFLPHIYQTPCIIKMLSLLCNNEETKYIHWYHTKIQEFLYISIELINLLYLTLRLFGSVLIILLAIICHAYNTPENYCWKFTDEINLMRNLPTIQQPLYVKLYDTSYMKINQLLIAGFRIHLVSTLNVFWKNLIHKIQSINSLFRKLCQYLLFIVILLTWRRLRLTLIIFSK